MAKETNKKTVKKATAPAKEEKPKKNPLLDADEDTAEDTAEETADETTDEEVDETDESEADEEAEDEAPKKATAPKASAPAEKPKVNADVELASDIRTTKQILEAEEKVHFMVPLFEGEKPGAVHECFINGYRYPVKKGIMVLIPRSIAELLSEHYKINAEAGADFRLDMNADKQNALG